MSCPSCGAPSSTGPCQKCSKGQPGDTWGSSFDSWGSSSGEWGKTHAVAASNWGGLPGASEPDKWSGSIATAPAPLAEVAGVDGWSSIPAVPVAPPVPRKVESCQDQPDGWGVSEPTISPAVARPAPALLGDPEEEEGWLCNPSTAKMGKATLLDDGYHDQALEPVRNPPPSWADEADEDWLDDEEDDRQGQGNLEPSLAATGGGTGLLWLAVAVCTLFLGLGAWSLQKPAAVAPPEQAAQTTEDPMESLHLGRRLVLAGNQALKTDPEGASYQLNAAVAALKKGGASAQEIRKARRLLAQSLMSDKAYEKAFAQWSQLRKVPEYKVEGAKALALAQTKLLGVANTHLLNAEGSLKADQYRQAETQAREALRLFTAFGGKASKRGMAHGAIGYANLNLGRAQDAWDHFTQADLLYPAGNYRSALQSMQPSNDAPGVMVSDPGPSSTTPVSATIDSNQDYPNGTGGKAPKPKPPKTPVKKDPAPVAAAVVKKPYVYKPTPPKPAERIRVDNTLETYKNTNKKRR
jgi:tetratricopeptide (TPR) repeat protein